MLDRPAGLKAREMRRQVFLRARMRAGGRPADICIRNMSSRGMLLQAADPPPRGAYVEILLARHTVVARVMWTKERRFGVHTREVMDVNGILDAGKDNSLKPAAALAAPAPPSTALTTASLRERHERSRRLSSMFEFLFMAVCAAAVAAVAAEAVYQRFGDTVHEVADHL